MLLPLLYLSRSALEITGGDDLLPLAIGAGYSLAALHLSPRAWVTGEPFARYPC
jgi:hypothetical protein